MKLKPASVDVLVVDDDKRARTALRGNLQSLGCHVHEADSGPALRAVLERRAVDLVLLDVRLGGESGLDLLPLLRTQAPAPFVAMMSALATVDFAVQAAQLGARACLAKPFVPADVKALVERVALERALGANIQALRERFGQTRPQIALQTESPRMLQTLDIVARVAAYSMPVLLRGERATGKATVARRLHALSVRAAGPFVTMACGAAPEDLLARELFGEAARASMDDGVARPGHVEAAAGGTLYLDEIGNLPPRLQSRLLRLIAEQRFERVGEQSARDADVRIVAGTNHTLDKDVDAGRFHRDLRERLRPFEIAVPSLRERREDILPLARRLLEFYCSHVQVKSFEMSLEAESALLGYAWPGNLRELAQAMERASILRVGTRIDVEALPDAVLAPAMRVPYLGGEFSLEAIEREHILRVLATASSVEEASRILDIDSSTLWRKRKRYQT
jgi:NtrC-family two-component system response regulator AlgB